MTRTPAARRLTPEEIQRIGKLLAEPDMTMEQISRRIGRSPETVRQVNRRLGIRRIAVSDKRVKR